MTPRRGQHRANGDGHHRPAWWLPGRRPRPRRALAVLLVLAAALALLVAVAAQYPITP